MRDLTFIRWGNLKPSKQLGYGSDSSHAPPAKNGLYAFVEGFVEPFLLGGFEFREDRLIWVRKKDGSLITEEDHEELAKYGEYNERWKYFELGEKFTWVFQTKVDPYEQFTNKSKVTKDKVRYLAKWKPCKKFKHYGEIWTHFQPKPNEILKVHDTWYLVTYKAFVKSLQKEWAREKAYIDSNGIGHSKDYHEVFIEKIISKKI